MPNGKEKEKAIVDADNVKDEPKHKQVAGNNQNAFSSGELHSQNRKEVFGLIGNSDKEKQTAELQDHADLENEYNYRQKMRVEQEKRTEEITKIFVNYRGQQEQRYRYKHEMKPKLVSFLLNIIIAIIAVLAIFSILLICIHELEGPSVVALVSGFVTCLGTVVSIFVIIIKYVFPEDEDKNFNDLVKSIITNDTVRIKDENDYRINQKNK